ncbi:Phage late control gene D protein (GPD) [Vibrio gazogenes DSM 21264]|uniref:Phage late control gene D protein (GPD) n=1 Tax=Vibrio gazogenes DSM 21264 = NBRC 103151 TaxID=1123492 RepID=A0A1M4TGU9_VIBGA|nr:Phage late control gene D protein (GPD) [Vibrio gazogenes DSM 21264] [Vibrio gazogenes DSM 21264 = NBRC 103151]SJN54226.1 hypothetical protein BQ6471_00890 [Vibrio gazogenes]
MNDLPLDYMALQGGRQFNTSLSFSVDVGHDAKTLNANYLRLVSLQGQEQVSEPYQFTLVLRGNGLNDVAQRNQQPFSDFSGLSALDKPIKSLPDVQGVAADLLGQWAQAKLGYSADFKPVPNQASALPGNPNTPLPSRYFQGIVSSVSLSAPGEFTAELVSPLFPLTLRNKYQVYKGLTIQGVLAALLEPETSRYGERFTVDYRITGWSASRVQDWLQAGETDFAMLQRLMNKAAIHFYFIHGDQGLTLVFSNQPSRQQGVAIPGASNGDVALRYSYTSIADLGLQQNDLLCNLSYKTQLTTQGVSSVLTHREANWETNDIAEVTSYPVADGKRDHSDFHFYKTFAYGVNQDESQESLSNIDKQLACQQTTLTGEATSYLLSPGYAFTLTQQATRPSAASTLNPKGTLMSQGQHADSPHSTAANLMPAQFDGSVFVVTKITHKVSEHSPYTGSVEATPLPKGAAAKQSDVLITPFNIQDTHQGSVLATVVESAVPKSSYFLEKGDFHTELATTQFGLEQADDPIIRQKQMGCVVQFVTDTGTDITHWVALSDGAQSAPAAQSIVMIGRGDNESEIPQIQQVVSSHGSKTIQPALWRNNSWMFNTNWGSSCNTSYGDSLNIHFGSEATPDLKTAMTIVQSAYGNPTVLGAKFGGADYDHGCSFSYSTTGQGAKGLANASVSQGSHFSESHSEQDYSVGYTNTRQSFSKTNKSVNVSYQGPFTEAVDESDLSFINGKIPNQEIIDICNNLPDGSSYNSNHVTGKSINLSGTGAPPPSAPSFIAAQSYSSSVVVGDTENHSEQHGNTSTTSVFNGNKVDKSTVTGDSHLTSSISGDARSESHFLGAKSDTSTVTGAATSMSSFLGARSDTNMVTGMTTSMNTFLGAKSDTNLSGGACTNMQSVLGISTDISNFSGVKMKSENSEGPVIDLNEAPVAGRTIESLLSVQIAVTNITLEGILSIL